MAYRNLKSYRVEKSILYDNTNTNALYGTVLYPDVLTMVAGYKRIIQGVVFGTNKKPIPRAKLIAPYASGDPVIHTNNPWLFFPGDVLYEIGDATENLIAEKAAIESGSAQILGTISSIDVQRQALIYEITPATPAIGDVFNLEIGTNFYGQTYSFTASTTDVADVTKGLADALLNDMQSHLGVVECLEVTEDGAKVTIAAKEPGEIFTIVPSVVGTTGTLTQVVSQGMGAITIIPDAGNSNHAVGAKVGKIDQLPLGIIAHDHYLTDDQGLDRSADIAAYDRANIYKKALPYLDGQIASMLSGCRFSPFYGDV